MQSLGRQVSSSSCKQCHRHNGYRHDHDHCFGQNHIDYQDDENDKEPPDDPDEDEHDEDLELEGVDRPPVVRELHEEGVVLLKAFRVRQGGGRLHKSIC